MDEYKIWMSNRETDEPTEIFYIWADSEAAANAIAEERNNDWYAVASEWTGASYAE